MRVTSLPMVLLPASESHAMMNSGRYPYTIGMNSEVIVDGAASCMPLTVSTIGDRLQSAGWATSAYGKWDCGMTSWGCTPTCRGFVSTARCIGHSRGVGTNSPHFCC